MVPPVGRSRRVASLQCGGYRVRIGLDPFIKPVAALAGEMTVAYLGRSLRYNMHECMLLWRQTKATHKLDAFRLARAMLSP